MIARTLMRFPPFRAAVCWLAGVPPRTALASAETYEQTLGRLASELVEQKGISAVAALASAEAVLIRSRGLRFDRVEFDEDLIEWFGVYESGPQRRPTFVKVPLAHATEAHRTGRAEAMLN